MIIRFHYKSFQCLHWASVCQCVNERMSWDIGFFLLDCPFFLLTVAKVRTFSTRPKLFASIFAKNVLFLCFFRLVYVYPFCFAISDIAKRTFNADY